ncbi:MAG: DUF3857 and transglutaminase domain-containing protein, partial [bacterium]|nr:DUF3857 and transglutaminase domain-containing protein [bacterium]
VPGEPNAPAVVLFRKGVFLMEYRGKESESIFTVRARIKILTEAGKRYGEVVLPHTRYRRLRKLEGRTVLADGRVLELTEKDTFKRRTSRLDKRFVTAAVFPGVEVGAILDYEYELRYQTIFALRPWLFQDRVPTVYSEISYEVPEHIGFRHWAKALPDKLRRETEISPRGRILRAWMENMPGIPEEPFGYPFADMSSQFMVLPTQYVFGGGMTDLLVSWPRVCDLLESSYHDHRSDDRRAKLRAEEVAAATGSRDKRDQATAVYRFVRDEIQLDSLYGVFVREGASVDSVLTKARGDEADQALLLEAMLKALKIEAELVWVADRAGGRIDINTPNPGWFDRIVVLAKLDGQELFLDPSDRCLGFGQLPPGLEGTQALVYHPRKPRVITLPVTPFDENARQAKVQLVLDDEGRLAGSGSLELTGHHAWRHCLWREDPEDTTEAWGGWLQTALSDFTLSDVEVKEMLDERRILVSWSMEQPEEEVLGDEASLRLSRPLGPVDHPFRASGRRLPILLPFGDRNETELSLSWPEGWEVEVLPTGLDYAGPAGAFVSRVEADAANRTVKYSRRFEVSKRDFSSPPWIQAIRTLYDEAERHDAQSLVLVRR